MNVWVNNSMSHSNFMFPTIESSSTDDFSFIRISFPQDLWSHQVGMLRRLLNILRYQRWHRSYFLYR